MLGMKKLSDTPSRRWVLVPERVAIVSHPSPVVKRYRLARVRPAPARD
jgi:hypothetical protein